MPNIFEMRSAYNQVLQMMYDEECDEQTIIDTLDAIEDAFEDKANGYAMIIRNNEADIKAIKEEETRLRNRRKALENKTERMKQNLFDAMKDIGKPKFKTALFSFGIQKNGGKRPLVLDVEAGMLPAYYREIEYKVNNDRLRESLGDAESNQWCHLEEQGESLRIR